MSNRRSSISRIVIDHAFVVAFGKCRNPQLHINIDISYFDILCFSQQANVCTVVPGDLFHILTKGRRYFVFEILSLFISIAHCLLWSNILIAVYDIYRAYKYIVTRQTCLHCYETISNARTGPRSNIHLRGRPRTNIRPCHCVGVQIDPAIVWVYQSIKRSHCAGIFKQYNPALLDQNQTACLLAGHT